MESCKNGTCESACTAVTAGKTHYATNSGYIRFVRLGFDLRSRARNRMFRQRRRPDTQLAALDDITWMAKKSITMNFELKSYIALAGTAK